MKASDVRFALFSLLVLVAVAGPGPSPKVRPGTKGPSRGVGCGGAKPGVPSRSNIKPGVKVSGSTTVNKPSGAPGSTPSVSRLGRVIILTSAANSPAEERAMSELSGKLEPLETMVGERQWGKVGPTLVKELDAPAFPAKLGEAVKPLRSQAEQLHALESVVLCLHRPVDPVSSETLQQAVNRLPDSPLKRDVSRLLVLRAERQGLREIARKLRPEGSEKDSMENLLRDLKVRQDLPDTGSSSAPGSPHLPLPEESQSVRPGIQERVPSGLPPLVIIEKEVHERLTQELHSGIDSCWNQLGQRMGQVCSQHGIPYGWRRSPPGQPTKGTRPSLSSLSPEQSEALIRQISAKLDRPLSPGERLMIPTMKEQGNDVKQIAGILRGLK